MSILFTNRASSVSGIALDSDEAAYSKYTFICNNGINFVANDSDTYSLYVNFDDFAGGTGTILLYPGETISDLKIQTRELYVRGIGGSVSFRAVGS